MSQPTNYFKIGLFVIIGVAILLVAIVGLSSQTLFHQKQYFETYFNESVDGIEIGTPVKFRGVEVGTVTKISFVGSVYPHLASNGIINRYARYIYVEMALELPFMKNLTKKRAIIDLQKAIKEGLRVKITPQGLTGAAYLEIDYFHNGHKPLVVTWRPKHFYIPSAPSTFRQLTKLFDEIHQANIPKLVQNMDTLIVNTNKTVVEGQFQKVGQRAVVAINNFDKLMTQLNHVVKEGQLDQTLRDLSKSSKLLNRSLVKLPKAVNAISQTANNADIIIASQQEQIQETLQNLQAITQNLRDMTGRIKQYPSQIVFGSPPPKVKRK